MLGVEVVKAMAQRGWINVRSMADLPRIKAELLRFFNCDSLDELEGLTEGDVDTLLTVWNRPSRKASR